MKGVKDSVFKPLIGAPLQVRLRSGLFGLAMALLGAAVLVCFIFHLEHYRQLPWIHQNLYLTEADAAFARGDYASAAAQYQTITVLDKGDFQAMMRLGMAAAADGKTGDALRAFDRALLINPACGDCLHRRGLIYLTEWWRGDALAELTAAAELTPWNPAIWADLGVARAQTGDRSGARVAFTRALTLAPNLSSARQNLARLEGGS